MKCFSECNFFLAVNDDDYFAKIQGAGRRPKVPDSNTIMVARLSLSEYSGGMAKTCTRISHDKPVSSLHGGSSKLWRVGDQYE